VDEFLITVMLPIFLIAIFLALHIVAKTLGVSWFKKEHNFYRCFFGTLFITFPGCASACLGMFSCKTLADGHEYLSSDMWIRCDDSSQTISTWFGENDYNGWKKAAGFFVFLYPVCVPLVFFGRLYYARNDLYVKDAKTGKIKIRRDDNKIPQGFLTNRAQSKSIGMLYTNYKPHFWWWEVVELIRKLILTSVVIFVMPGSPSQFAFGILIAIFFLVVYSSARPYVDKVNSVLQMTVQVAIFLVLFGGLLIASQVSTDDRWDDDALGGMMAFITIFPLVLGAAMIIYTMVSLFLADIRELCGCGKKPEPDPQASQPHRPNELEGQLAQISQTTTPTPGAAVAVSASSNAEV
jgi:hypothetical protein